MVEEKKEEQAKTDEPKTETSEFDINKLVEEMTKEEEENRKKQDEKLKELETKNVSKEELKKLMKDNLKYTAEQKKVLEESLTSYKAEYEKKLSELTEKLEKVSMGSKAGATPIESDPHKLNQNKQDDGEWTDEKALKHFGVLR